MKYLFTFFAGVLVILAAVFTIEHHTLLFQLRSYIEGAYTFSGVAYVFLLFSVGVYLPLNAIPLIPFGAGIFGPVLGTILSIFGWVSGASAAFLLSRSYGRSIVERFAPIAKVDKILESIPEKNRLFALIVFRLVLPSDMASYALGLTKSLSFKHYFIATTVSYSIYATSLSFLGHSILEGRFVYAILWGGALLVIFAFSWYLLKLLRN